MPAPIGARHALFGPRTVGKHTKISEHTADVLRRLARQAEKSESDFIATLIEIRCHGMTVVQRIECARLEVVSGEYPKKHGERDGT